MGGCDDSAILLPQCFLMICSGSVVAHFGNLPVCSWNVASDVCSESVGCRHERLHNFHKHLGRYLCLHLGSRIYLGRRRHFLPDGITMQPISEWQKINTKCLDNISLGPKSERWAGSLGCSTGSLMVHGCFLPVFQMFSSGHSYF